jgi:predicted DNA-binding transcriptional regulator AlpA
MQTTTKQSQTALKALSTPEAQIIFEDLKADGYGINISKKEYAKIVGCSVSAVDNYISKGYGVPNYKKIGNARNARVLFSLRDVAEYLAAQIVQTA